MISSSEQESTLAPSDNVKRGRARHDLIDISKPSQYLLGWHNFHWELVCDELLTHEESCKVFDKGMEPYEKFMVVTPSEFRHLGMPEDEAASVYFDLSRQREVSLRNHSGRRAHTPAEYAAVVDRITDPLGE